MTRLKRTKATAREIRRALGVTRRDVEVARRALAKVRAKSA